MIYPRLVLARNMLRNDGVIFISMDDNEVDNLKKLCNEAFGEEYHLATFIWHRRQMPDSRNQTRASTDHEYVLAYAKPEAILRGKEIDKSKYSNPDNDPRGDWFSADLTGLANKEQRPNLHYDVVNPQTGIIYPPNPTRGWSCNKKTMQRLIEENRILWPSKPDGRPRQKKFLSEVGNLVTSFSTMLDVGYTTEGTRALQELFQEKLFSYPKPVSLIQRLIEQGSDTDGDIILDFFAGSSTTAQAVFQQCKKDGINRRFILVQLPELTDSKANHTICEIGKERIRRAGEKVKEEAGRMGQNLDIGFRVLKLDSTNMRDVYYAAGEYTQDLLASMEDNIKEDRSDMDLLYACLLDWGLPLSMPHAQEKIGGFTVHTYNDGDLIACFDKYISDAIVKEIAKRQPLRAVFRDSSFASSPEKINVEEIFKLLAPNTSVKVL
jgi:adenine-specific DNA-methyltransferase